MRTNTAPGRQPPRTGARRPRRSSVPARPIDLSLNENVLSASPLAITAARREARAIHRYPERQSAALLSGLARLHGVEPQQILVGNGAHHVLRLIAAAFLTHEDATIALVPTYPGYAKATKMVHASYRALPALAGGYDVAVWVHAAASARVAWCCTPNNPTGAILRHRDAVRIVEALPEGGAAVFDETYRDFANDPEAADGLALVRAGARVVVVRTFSKLYGLAGARVGYAVTRPDLAAAMLNHLDAFPVNRFGQAAAAAALSDPDHQAATRAYVLQGRSQLEAGLRRLGIEFFPSQANFVTANFGEACDRVIQAVREAGYLVRAMDGPWGLSGWVRITVGLEEHNTAVLGAIEVALTADQTASPARD